MEVNESWITELFEAVKNRRGEDLKELISHGDPIDVEDVEGKSVLIRAAEHGHSKIIETLIKSLVQVDFQDQKRGYTALHEAALRNHAESVRLLALGAADVNLQDLGKRSPIHYATVGGDKESVQFLLKALANPDLRSRNGSSVTHKAAQHGHIDILELLLQFWADPNLQDNDGCTPLHIAARCGHADAVAMLLQAGADPNASNKSSWSPLHLAAMCGHETVVLHLLEEGCDSGMRDAAGLTAAALACFFGHIDALKLILRNFFRNKLDDEKIISRNLLELLQLPENTDNNLLRKVRQWLHSDVTIDDNSARHDIPDDDSLSMELNNALVNAGFVQSRAGMQSSLADVLQDIERKRWSNNDIHIVGSYSDGWGNSLIRLTGNTDLDADIDQTKILRTRVFHLRGFCRCTGVRSDDLVDYSDGHVQSSGTASTPAVRDIGSSLRPAIDAINANICCVYPPIQLLNDGYETKISPWLVESLRQDRRELPCHLVAATPPKKEGQCLRVSCSFLERRLMRSLTSIQGQVFVILKHIFKKVLERKVQGSLKTYHAKSLMFYLLHKTPVDEWQARNLLDLTSRALRRLLRCLKNTSFDSDQCMKHFFLRHAYLYLRKRHCGKEKIVAAVNEVLQELPQLLIKFQSTLRPVSNDGFFHFHPFLIIPDTEERPVPASDKVPYHSVSDAVKRLLVELSEKSSSSLDSVLQEAERLPNFAFTARQTLIALAYIKHGMQDEAVCKLRSTQSNVSKGVPHSVETGSSETFANIRQHLNDTDSAWKFSFWFEAPPPRLDFLPKTISRHFPMSMQYTHMVYMNMQALFRSLCLHMDVVDEATARAWFEEAVLREEPDPQELLMTLELCKDRDLLLQIIHRHRGAICDKKELLVKVYESILAQTDIRQMRAIQILETAVADVVIA